MEYALQCAVTAAYGRLAALASHDGCLCARRAPSVHSLVSPGSSRYNNGRGVPLSSLIPSTPPRAESTLFYRNSRVTSHRKAYTALYKHTNTPWRLVHAPLSSTTAALLAANASTLARTNTASPARQTLAAQASKTTKSLEYLAHLVLSRHGKIAWFLEHVWKSGAWLVLRFDCIQWRKAMNFVQ